MKVLKIATALLLFSVLASAAPCTLGVTAQPVSPVAGQPVALSYSAPYLGFIQAPSVAIDGNRITIDQPTVHADPASPGDVPCGQGLVQLGTLSAGYYTVTVRLSTSSPMSGSFVVISGSEGLCSDAGAFATDPVTPTAGRPLVLSFMRITPLFFSASSFSVIGNQITVYDYVSFIVPPLPYPVPLRCVTTSAAIASLPAGEYVVHWIVVGLNGGGTDAGTYTFAVVAPEGRRRAAR
jgi:hypothetical protein